MTLAWTLSPPWDWLLIVVLLILVSAGVFWLSFTAYQQRYFFNKALQLSVLRTVAWLVLYGGSFALVFWLVSLFLSPGVTRYFVGSAAWWLLANTALAIIWNFLDGVWEAL